MSAVGRPDLTRLLAAQDSGGSYEGALRELRAGRKRSHWMWWVFPQVAGLGQSPTSRHYALAGLEALGGQRREPAPRDLAGQAQFVEPGRVVIVQAARQDLRLP